MKTGKYVAVQKPSYVFENSLHTSYVTENNFGAFAKEMIVKSNAIEIVFKSYELHLSGITAANSHSIYFLERFY